jgi:hypothetical protein
MPAMPRIIRAVPHGPINRPELGIPVFATIHWANGGDQVVPAIATAWTREAVEVTWGLGDSGLRSDWIPVDHVSRGPRSLNAGL